MPATPAPSDLRCDAEADSGDGAACPRPAVRRAKGRALCAEHHQADVKERRRQTNAKSYAKTQLAVARAKAATQGGAGERPAAGGLELTASQAQALREGIGELNASYAVLALAVEAFEEADPDDKDDERVLIATDGVADTVDEVLALWREALPAALLYIPQDDLEDADG